MHVLITGGAGFIGSHLSDYHLSRGDKVYVVDNLSTGRLENIATFSKHPDFTFEEADVQGSAKLEAAIRKADRIYHLAAMVGVFNVLNHPIQVLTENIGGCARILKVAREGETNPTVVIASTSEVYGLTPAPVLIEEAELIVQSGGGSRWNYATSKIVGEALGLSYWREFGVPVVIARIFNTIGPRQTGAYGMVVPRFIEQAVRGEPITIYGDGKQTRSFCDVRDLVAILNRLASKPESYGNIVNVGNDREISITTLADMIRGMAGSVEPHRYISYEEAYHEETKEFLRRRPSLEKLTQITGFTHHWTLEKTLDDLIESSRSKRAA